MQKKINILERIIENKKKEIIWEVYKEKKKYIIEDELQSNAENFKQLFSKKNAGIIWEIKIASPKFDYSQSINMEEVFKFYGETHAIKAVSNLIDTKYFKGSILRGSMFKKQYKKPIFFKEFVISKKQIDWAHFFWYDAILLLARVLDTERIIDFIKYANTKKIFPIVEVDCDEDTENILNIQNIQEFGIAINCRNLWTMEIQREQHFNIVKKYKNQLKEKIVFAFSWIDNLNKITEYKGLFNGVLVGSYFMNKLKKKC